MNRDEFDRALMDEVGQLPPGTEELNDYTPWQAAVSKILWGMGLTTFRVEVLYLHYLLPLLGSALLYLGYRSLRKENRWFQLCWVISGLKLAFHMVLTVLDATPLLQALSDSPWNTPLSVLANGANVLLLFALRGGIRTAFASTGEEKSRDWLGLGLLAYLASLAIAVWGYLVPLTEETMFGRSLIHEYLWLYYGRSIAFIALQIFLLVCIYRQGTALAGRGYDITPAPVRLPGKTLLLAVFLGTLAALPPALWLGSHIPMEPAEEVSAPLAGSQGEVRDRLMALGLPEDIAWSLDREELEQCAGALAVRTVVWSDLDLTDDEVPLVEGDALVTELGGGTAELSSWLVFLPGGQVRYYHWFRYREMPSLRLQEQFSVDPSGNYETNHYTARLLWEQDGRTCTVRPQVKLAGGQTAEELDEFALWWNEHELERLGHLHYSPWFSFSIPRGAEELRGYLAYTLDASPFLERAEENENFYDFAYVLLRHQNRWLHYPFVSIDDLGGARRSADYGPIQSAFGSPYYCAPFPS